MKIDAFHMVYAWKGCRCFKVTGRVQPSTQQEVLCSAMAGEEEMNNGVFFMCLSKGLLIFCSD